MNYSVLQAIVAFIFGHKYYANIVNTDLKLLSKSLSEYDLKELLYQYTSMGNFNSFAEVCERLHELLGD